MRGQQSNSNFLTISFAIVLAFLIAGCVSSLPHYKKTYTGKTKKIGDVAFLIGQDVNIHMISVDGRHLDEISKLASSFPIRVLELTPGSHTIDFFYLNRFSHKIAKKPGKLKQDFKAGKIYSLNYDINQYTSSYSSVTYSISELCSVEVKNSAEECLFCIDRKIGTSQKTGEPLTYINYKVLVDSTVLTTYPAYLKPQHPIVSENGKRIAYIMRLKKWKHNRVVVDGVSGNGYEILTPAAFTDDSKHYAYFGANNDNFVVVVDGVEYNNSHFNSKGHYPNWIRPKVFFDVVDKVAYINYRNDKDKMDSVHINIQ